MVKVSDKKEVVKNTVEEGKKTRKPRIKRNIPNPCQYHKDLNVEFVVTWRECQTVAEVNEHFNLESDDKWASLKACHLRSKGVKLDRKPRVVGGKVRIDVDALNDWLGMTSDQNTTEEIEEEEIEEEEEEIDVEETPVKSKSKR